MPRITYNSKNNSLLKTRTITTNPTLLFEQRFINKTEDATTTSKNIWEFDPKQPFRIPENANYYSLLYPYALEEVDKTSTTTVDLKKDFKIATADTVDVQ